MAGSACVCLPARAAKVDLARAAVDELEQPGSLRMATKRKAGVEECTVCGNDISIPRKWRKANEYCYVCDECQDDHSSLGELVRVAHGERGDDIWPKGCPYHDGEHPYCSLCVYHRTLMPTKFRYETKDAALDALRYGRAWALRHASAELRADPEVFIAAADAHVLSLIRVLREEGSESSDDDDDAAYYKYKAKYTRLRRTALEFVGFDGVDTTVKQASRTITALRAENERLRSEQTVEVFDVDADVVTREQKRPRTEEPPSSALKAMADIAEEFSAKNVGIKQERDAATQRANAAEDRLECCVCQDAAHQVMLGPCRHLCCCATCAPALTECPICRTPVESRTTVFF